MENKTVRLSICIEMFCPVLDFLDRIDAVANQGIMTFEFWGWREKDITAIVEHKARLGMEVGAISVDPWIVLTEPDSKDAFVNSVSETCQIAKRLGCKRLITLVSEPFPGEESTYDTNDTTRRRKQRQTLVSNLKAAAPVAEDAGVVLILEPLNTLVDHMGYWLVSSREGFGIIEEVGSPAVKLLFDVYHQQISEGNLIKSITRNIDKIGHIHIADVPGRHEPGTGEINFRNVLKETRKAGYSGLVGLECTPSVDCSKGCTPCKALLAIRNIMEEVINNGC